MRALQYHELDSQSKPTSIEDLPNEILQNILLFAPACSITTFQRVCRRFSGIVDAFNWRHLCQQEFCYWDPSHGFHLKTGAQAKEVYWKKTYIQRHHSHRETTRLLDSILSAQVDRIDKFQRIITIGYDAKDCLLQHLAVDDNAEDVLARR